MSMKQNKSIISKQAKLIFLYLQSTKTRAVSGSKRYVKYAMRWQASHNHNHTRGRSQRVARVNVPHKVWKFSKLLKYAPDHVILRETSNFSLRRGSTPPQIPIQYGGGTHPHTPSSWPISPSTIPATHSSRLRIKNVIILISNWPSACKTMWDFLVQSKYTKMRRI